MDESSKNAILFTLDLLQTALKETNTVVGLMINKKDFNYSQIAFVSYDSYVKGNSKDGFTISLQELNKGIIN